MKAYLSRVTRNAAIDYLRGRGKRSHVSLDSVVASFAVADESVEPEYNATVPEEIRVIEQVVEGLPKSYGRIIKLIVAGKKVRHIGKILGISRSAASWRLNHAREMLARRLMEEGIASEVTTSFLQRKVAHYLNGHK